MKYTNEELKEMFNNLDHYETDSDGLYFTLTFNGEERTIHKEAGNEEIIEWAKENTDEEFDTEDLDYIYSKYESEIDFDFFKEAFEEFIYSIDCEVYDHYNGDYPEETELLDIYLSEENVIYLEESCEDEKYLEEVKIGQVEAQKNKRNIKLYID